MLSVVLVSLLCYAQVSETDVGPAEYETVPEPRKLAAPNYTAMGGGGGGGKAPRAPLVGGANSPKKQDLQRQQKQDLKRQQKLKQQKEDLQRQQKEDLQRQQKQDLKRQQKLKQQKEDLQRQQKLKQQLQQQLQSSDSDSSDSSDPSGEICECEFYDYGCRFEGFESVVVVHELTCRFKDAEGMNALEMLQLKRQVEASLGAGPEDLPKDVQDDLDRVDSEIKQINFNQVRCNRDSVCGDICWTSLLVFSLPSRCLNQMLFLIVIFMHVRVAFDESVQVEEFIKLEDPRKYYNGLHNAKLDPKDISTGGGVTVLGKGD